MQAKLTVEREVLEFHPGTKRPHAPPELVAQCVRRGAFLFAPVGTLIDDPDCWRIVLMGQAEPADDECREQCQQTPEQHAAAVQAFKEMPILPKDRPKFRAGEILGYAADGSYIPGPNWTPATAKQEDEEEE